MAVALNPTAWLGSGYSLGTNQAIINTAQHATPVSTEITNTVSHATTGDIRQFLMGLLDKIYTAWLGFAEVDRPAKMTLTRTTSENSSGNMVRTFYITFILDEVSTQSVDGE